MAGIIVVFPKIEDSKAIRNLLVRNGYDNVFHCSTGAKAITLADSLGEGVIISGYRMLDCHIHTYWIMSKEDLRCC